MKDRHSFKILVVDDQIAGLKGVSRIMRKAGYETLEAATGQDCLALAVQHKPDLILLDVVLPDIDGREVCRRIKSDPETSDTYVVLLSSVAIGSDTQAEGMEHGADGYIARPVPNRELLARVKALIRLKQTEKRLQESQEQLALAIEGSGLGLWDWRIRTGEVIFNERWATMIGYTLEELEPTDINTWAELVHPDDLKGARELIRKRIEGRTETYECETRIKRKDGDWIWVLDRGKVVQWDKDGKALRMIGTHLDITARKEAEKEKESLQAQLFHSHKMEALGTLVGGIAHDFNNMLQIMMGYADFLLTDKKEGEPGFKELRTIVETGQSGAELVSKLMAFGSQSQAIPVPLELNQKITHLAQLLLPTLPQLVDVELDLTDAPTAILGDHSQIDQVIMNLAINAAEAMPGGGKIKIATALVALDHEYCKSHLEAKPGNYVDLTISDNGRGMDRETLSRIFEPFFSTKQRGATKGTGLGLSVVQGIVRQHGGHITCQSEPGKGTEFRIYFPEIVAKNWEEGLDYYREKKGYFSGDS